MTNEGPGLDRRCLRIAIAPVLVMLIADVVFELSSVDLRGMSAAIAAGFPATEGIDVATTITGLRTQVLWGASVLLFDCIAVAVVAASVLIMRQTLTGAQRKRYLLAWLALTVLSVGHVVYSAQTDSSVAALYGFTMESLTTSGRFDGGQLGAIKGLVTTLNLAAVTVPGLGLVTVCSTLTPERAGTSVLAHLVRQLRRLKIFLNLGSAMLVSGILHMHVWLRWPSVLVDDPALGAEIDALASSVSIFWGVAYSLTIIAFYVPASLELNRRAEQAVNQTPDELGSTKARDWLTQNGFTPSPSQQFRQVAVMLAPLLAGPVGSNIADFAAIG